MLPKLDKNIVCGNSLIGTDILTGQLFASDEEKKLNPMDFEQRFPHIFRKVGRVTPCAPGEKVHDAAGSGVPALPDELHDAAPGELDYTMPGVPLHGAFSYKKKKNAKVARPTLPEFEGGFDAIVGNPPYLYSAGQSQKDYFERRFGTSEYQTDFYVYFVERAIRHLKHGGVLGMIVSDSWIKGKYFTKLRDFSVPADKSS